MSPRSATACIAALLVLSGVGRAGTTVAIVKGKDVDRMVAEAVELLGGMSRFVRDGQKVVLKPNLVYQPGLPYDGPIPSKRPVREEFTTDIRIVKALARQMRAAAKCTVTVAEGTPASATRLFEYLGYKEMAAELGIALVDVDTSPRMAARVDGLASKEYQMPVVTQTCDVLVDLPAMKTHGLAGVSLGMKNLFGLLPMPKGAYHAKVNEVICDLTLLHKPDLVIVDALVALEGQGPLNGTPVPMDLLVAGTDVVAVDAVCCAVMGIDASRIGHLRLAAEHGIGEIDLGRIAIKGVPIGDVRREFRQARCEAEVRIKATDALVARLVRLAPKVEKHWKGGSLLMTFTSGLKADRARFPNREPEGFTVTVPPQGDEILFRIPYKVIYEENGQSACDEMERWIHAKLGEGIAVTKSPRGAKDQASGG